MIFGSLFLLVVSAILFAVGVGKSSVGYLTLALIAAAAAGVLLLAGYLAHRRRLELEAGTSGGAGSAGGAGTNGHVTAQPMVLVPVSAIAGGQQFVVTSGVAGPAAVQGMTAAPIVGYDAMSASQVVQLVRSGMLTDEQLDAIRAYETATHGRKTVLDALGRGARA